MEIRSSNEKASNRIQSRSRFRKFVSRLVKISFIVLSLVVFCFFVWSPLFRFKNVEVVGDVNDQTKTLISDKILEIINTSGFIPRSHVLFIDTKNIKGVLSKDFSSISQIDINRSLFKRKISIKIKQFEPYFLWCSGADCFDMTKDGFVFSKNIYKDDKKIIFYSSDINPISKYILDKDIMNNLVESIEKLDIYGAKVSMIDVSLKNKTKITTSLGNIIVNLGEPLDNQIDSAIIVFNDISKNFNSKVLDYIDVRFGNKVFYK